MLQDFDIVKETGTAHKILVKEFHGIKADSQITIDFLGRKGATLISGIEILAEGK
jgi:hypothetical protein